MGWSWPPSNMWFLGPTRVQIPNCIWIGSAIFAQRTSECPYTFQWASPSPFIIAPCYWGIWTPSITWFLEPTRVLNPDYIWIGSAVFAGLITVTYPTDHATLSITICHIYIRTTKCSLIIRNLSKWFKLSIYRHICSLIWKLECGPMTNVMVALPNIGGTLCSTPQFGWRPLLECCAVMLPSCETRWKYPGCPKLPNQSQPLVGRSSPYCEDMWRRYCCLTSFFRLSICALVAEI